jgi:hypothetical protein
MSLFLPLIFSLSFSLSHTLSLRNIRNRTSKTEKRENQITNHHKNPTHHRSATAARDPPPATGSSRATLSLSPANHNSLTHAFFFFLSAGPKIINPNPKISIPKILIS